jgi:hypothetical protein
LLETRSATPNALILRGNRRERIASRLLIAERARQESDTVSGQIGVTIEAGVIEVALPEFWVIGALERHHGLIVPVAVRGKYLVIENRAVGLRDAFSSLFRECHDVAGVSIPLGEKIDRIVSIIVIKAWFEGDCKDWWPRP